MRRGPARRVPYAGCFALGVCPGSGDVERVGQLVDHLRETWAREIFPSRARWSSLRFLSVDKARLGERIGPLSDARVEAILAGVRFQQASYFGR